MTNTFIILFFISVLATITGLIKPRIFRLRRLYIAIIFGSISLLLLIATGVSALNSYSIPTENTSIPTPQNVTEVSQEEQKPLYVFDIPSLIDKNVDQVSVELATYKKKTLDPTSEQIKAGVSEWEMEFEKDGKSLLVTYDIASKKIKDFFISADDPSGATKDKSHLLDLGNLTENDTKYKIEFVKVRRDPSSFTGVKVTPTL